MISGPWPPAGHDYPGTCAGVLRACTILCMSEAVTPRLRLATDEELPEKMRGRHDLVTRVFGHNSVLLESWYKWYGPLIRDLSLPARLKEICRFRVAQLNSCEF